MSKLDADQRSDRRRAERLKTSVRCTVNWGPRQLSGRIENLSLRGALITQVNTSPPPEGAVVVVRFQFKKDHLEIVSSVSSIVVRSMSEIVRDGIVGSFAIQFEDQSSEVQSQLRTILEAFNPPAQGPSDGKQPRHWEPKNVDTQEIKPFPWRHH